MAPHLGWSNSTNANGGGTAGLFRSTLTMRPNCRHGQGVSPGAESAGALTGGLSEGGGMLKPGRVGMTIQSWPRGRKLPVLGEVHEWSLQSARAHR